MSAKVSVGFDFLGRHFQRYGDVLEVTPSQNSANEFKYKLKDLVENYSGSLRSLVLEVNAKLSRFSKEHATEDAYVVSCQIDSFVEGLFIAKLGQKYPKWGKKAILNRFFITDANNHIFVLPEDTRVRVIRIAPTAIKKHNPCATWFNPYLDEKYYAMLQHKREIQKSSIRLQRVWNRQNGLCLYCGQRMLSDQDLDIVEIINGHGSRTDNLAYIHAHCANNTYSKVERPPIDLAHLLRDFLEDTSLSESPYQALAKFL